MPCEGVPSCFAVDAWQEVSDLLLVVQAAFESLLYSTNTSVELAKQHLLSVIVLASLAFALWNWRRYRDKTLLRRLDKMLAREALRLRDLRTRIFQDVLRPSVGNIMDPPTLARGPLRRFLRRRGWLPPLSLAFREQTAGQALKKTVSHLQNQRAVRRKVQAQLEQLLASVYLLRSAVDGIRAERVADHSLKQEFQRRALHHIDCALSLPDNEADPDALELKVCQLMRAERPDAAQLVLEALKKCVNALPASDETECRLARVLKCEAVLIRQAGEPEQAYAALTSALALLNANASLAPADLLERAQIWELHAELAHSLGFSQQAPRSQDEAKVCYEELIETVRPRNAVGRFAARGRRLLHRQSAGDVLLRAAVAGLERVQMLGVQSDGAESVDELRPLNAG
jgi:hypothetical protein